MITLNASSLNQIADAPGAPAVPTYDLAQRRIGIVHFGVGGFHRAHQALYLDRLMNTGEAMDWAICGVGLLPGDVRMRDALVPQGGLYTLVTKAPDGTRDARVIGTLADYLFAPDDPEAVLGRMTDPAVRIVSLTVTEGGYNYNASTGEFQFETPAVSEDLEADFTSGAAPKTMFGYVIEALRRRRESGKQPFTVLSCDNVRGNGDLARRMLLAYALRKDPQLADWVAEHVSFPNCMVDRITPATADADRTMVTESFGVQDAWPVVSEDFIQWVLEDRFPAGRPAFERVGVQMVEDVEPYELMKLRLLNCSHQAIAYFGLLLGHTYAHEAVNDEDLSRFTRMGYMDAEGTPAVGEVPGTDLGQYKDQLMQRFGNEHVRDALARLAAESSDRIPTWLVPVIRENLAAGRDVGASAAIVASWARYAEGLGEKGERWEVVDRQRERVMARAASHEEDILAFLRDGELFGDLVDQPAFTEPYAEALRTLRADGARVLLQRFLSSAG